MAEYARTVTNQTEFDQAVVDGVSVIDVAGSAKVAASGSVKVRASGSAKVIAYDSATVRAYGSATVAAYGSAMVIAYDSVTVAASDSVMVIAYDSVTVIASGSATVRAYGSATVTAYDSATVTAYGSVTVRASDSATVAASDSVAVHDLGKSTTIDGGVVIEPPDRTTMAGWCSYQGVQNTGKTMVVFKAVDGDLKSGYRFEYPIGETVKCGDWVDSNECGQGFHFSPHPHMAAHYFPEATRFLACRVSMVKDVVLLGDKVKARTAKVLYEVDIDGGKII